MWASHKYSSYMNPGPLTTRLFTTGLFITLNGKTRPFDHPPVDIVICTYSH